MINEDTIYLLRECNAGTQMAVYSIGEILENVKDQKLREILISSKNPSRTAWQRTHILLQKYGDTTKDPGVIAKGMILDQNRTQNLPSTTVTGSVQI